MIYPEQTGIVSLSLWLKEGTSSTHDSLDKRIMSLSPFDNLERYSCFLRTQSRLHQAISSWFYNKDIQTWLPDLKERDRSDDIILDCHDFEMTDAQLQQDQQAVAETDIANAYVALGWLYTVEGSNLGAAILLRYARKELDLSEQFGARHLAAHNSGRGEHWLQFKQAMDGLQLTESQREMALDGAKQAFSFARNNVEQLLAPVAETATEI
jgi:heme oxygenase